MSPKKYFLLTLPFLLLLACNLSFAGNQPDPEMTPTVSITEVVQTMEAQLTQAASDNGSTSVPGDPTSAPEQATNTPLPSNTPLPTNTLFPTNTPFPTFTPTPAATNTPVSTPTATPLPCNAAAFIADVSVPDGAQFHEDAKFTKTWRIKNVGSCTWTTDYDLVYIDGSKLKAPDLVVAFPKTVKPGETIDLSLKLTAPDKEGTYKGNWKLRTANNVVFGLGDKSDTPLWVSIVVVEVNFTHVLDFAEDFCKATWKSGAGTLPCWGPDKSLAGFVQWLAAPKFETGYKDDEPALLMHPDAVKDGWISGEYPAFTVEDGDVFVAQIGCLFDKKDCKVTFRLDYRLPNGNVKTLGTWNETYDGSIRILEVDLSELAGTTVNFILYVSANGSADGDYAFWFSPYIRR